MDPELDRALEALPWQAREVLGVLRVRLLLAPGVHAQTGEEPRQLSTYELDALQLLDQALKKKESQ